MNEYHAAVAQLVVAIEKFRLIFNKLRVIKTNFDNQLTTLPHSKTRQKPILPVFSFIQLILNLEKKKKRPYVLIWLAKKRLPHFRCTDCTVEVIK